MTLLAVLCAAASVALLLPGRSLAPAPGLVGPRLADGWSRPGVLILAAGAAALLFTAQGSVLVLGAILLCATAAVLRLAAGARRRGTAARREERVLEVCEVLVGELRSGQPPMTAIGRCVEVWPDFEDVAAAARLGADVPTALRRLGETRGASGLREVADAWVVSHGSGAGLAAAVGQVAASSRDAQATRRLVVSELASAQATARLVAVLPAVTLVMGSGIGGDPWGFLLRTPVGLSCLAAGLAMALLGLTWIDRIADAVTRG